MAPRKRKVKVIVPSNSPEKAKFSIIVIQTVLNGQESETSHAKLHKELKNIYPMVPHESFMKSFIQSLKGAFQHEEANEYTNNQLKLCAKFIADPDYSEQEETHPIILSLFDWLLGTISPVAVIRFRICQFVNQALNAMGPEASLDDDICDKILRYMLERIRDVAPNVRVQAVLALQRLQNPDDPEDCVFRTYIYHLDTDPSPKVRQTIITSLGRNYRTIPYIIERLWDVEERVRRHTYLQMSSYPVKQYKVAQRLTFLEQGLNDHADAVRKVVKNVLIPQWFESYQKNYVSFVKALKIDADEKELERFRNTAKLALFEIFSKYGIDDAMTVLGMREDDKTVPLETLTIETAICWQALLNFLQKTESDELENLMVDLSTFCNYIKVFADNPTSCNYIRMLADDPSMITDKLQKMYFQSMLQILLEIVDSYDFGDEFGRETLKKILADVLCCCDLDEDNVKIILSIFERLVGDVETRFKFFVDLINSVLEPSRTDVSNSSRSLVDEYLEKNPDKSLQMKISSLRLTIMDLKEQEMDKVNKKDYKGAQRVSEELNVANEEYAALLKPILLEVSSSSDGSQMFRESMLKPKKITNATINKCLQISFYLVNSVTVRSLTPIVCDLYKSFISRYVESAEIATRDWALRCSIAFSMLYDGLSKETFQLLYQQFFRNHCTKIWQTSIEGIFELMDHYGFEHFEIESKKDDTRKNSRQLYNTMDYLDQDDDANTSSTGTGGDLMRMMTHFFETCEDNVICSAIVDGFCRLILRGHCTSQDIMSKLLLKYFNPTTEPKTQQILGIFFECLIKKKRQEILQKALLSTLFTILEAPNDSPLQEVKPEHVLKFVIDSTKPVFCSAGLNPHNSIAISFLQVMLDNLNYKDLMKLLSKELLSLEISEECVLRNDLNNCTDQILQEPSLDVKIIKNLNDFKQMLQGTYREPISFSSSRAPPIVEEQEAGNISEPEEMPEVAEEEENTDPKDKDIPIINKSSLSKDDSILTQSSPVRSTGPPTAAVAPVTPVTPTTFGADNTAGMKSLRKSMNFLGFPEREVVPKNVFKVPDANATKKLRQQQQKAADKKNQAAATAEKESDPHSDEEPLAEEQSEESFAIPSTQDMTDVTSIDGDHSILHLEIPETQQPAEEKEAEEQEQPEEEKKEEAKEKDEELTTNDSSGAVQRTPSKRKISEDSITEEAISASSDDSISSNKKRPEKDGEEDVVNPSPNATITRFDRSVVRPLVKASAKPRAGTPRTLPRTRHAAIELVKNTKVMTRKSLSEISGKKGAKRTSLSGIKPLEKSPPASRRGSRPSGPESGGDKPEKAGSTIAEQKKTTSGKKKVEAKQTAPTRSERRSGGGTNNESNTSSKQKDSSPKEVANKKSTEKEKVKRISKSPTRKETTENKAKTDDDTTSIPKRSSRKTLDKNESTTEATKKKAPSKPDKKASASTKLIPEKNSEKPSLPKRATRKTLEKADTPSKTGETTPPSRSARGAKKTTATEKPSSTRPLRRQVAVDTPGTPSSKSSAASIVSSTSSTGGPSEGSSSQENTKTPVKRRVSARVSKGRISTSPKVATMSASSISSGSSDSSSASPVRAKRAAVTPLSAVRATRTTSTPTRPVRKLAKK